MIQHLVTVTIFLLFLPSVFVRSEALTFQVRDSDGNKLPCRIHVTNSKGETQKPAVLPFWYDHFVCDGDARVNVVPGNYAWTIERGPEYDSKSGSLRVTANMDVEVVLSRLASLRSEGWYSGDLHVHRKIDDIKLLMTAEDLDYAPVIQWWNAPAKDVHPLDSTEFQFDGHRIYSAMAGEDERAGGALLYFGLNRPLDLSVKSREFPSPMKFVQEARSINENAWIDIEKPFWWDVPTWLASGKMNSIGLANNHMNRSGMLVNEAWGKRRDIQRLPNPRGNGFWTQEIYYHILDAGLRIPPSAGSASGVLKNPVGYNRVYVQLNGSEFTREHWFESLAAGRCFVTNGPLLRVKANGTWPGATLKLSSSDAREVEFDIFLTTNDPISEVEIIYNGRVVKRITCTDKPDQHLSGRIEIDQPGWFLVRVIADIDSTFRFASTAPWFVESDRVKNRISRSSAQFFLDWTNDRISRINRNVANSESAKKRTATSPTSTNVLDGSC